LTRQHVERLRRIAKDEFLKMLTAEIEKVTRKKHLETQRELLTEAEVQAVFHEALMKAVAIFTQTSLAKVAGFKLLDEDGNNMLAN